MNKIKVLSYSVVVLVILNLGIIVFFMIIKPREIQSFRNGPRVMIIERLRFDDQQRKQFRVLIEEHKLKMESLETQILRTKEKLYLQLSESKENLKVKDSLIGVLGDFQKEIEMARFNHFKEIRKICNTPEQKEYFKELTNELARKIPQQNLKPKNK